jgi:DNA-directed RNA polymerase subunit RPC12/RpoP
MIWHAQNTFFLSTKVNNSFIFKFLNIVNRKNPQNIEVKYKCPYTGCSNTYTLKNKLLAHLRTHFGMKPYICSLCSKEFNDKGNLKTHLRIHTGERPYKCKVCYKAFKTEGQLREHFGSHYRDKPFQCPYCLKYYKRKGVVKNHILIHYNDPLFLEKKEYYINIVDNLDNKNSMNLNDFYYKNSTNLFSTKDETQNNSPVVHKLKPDENSIKELSFNSDLLNRSNTDDDSSENKNTFINNSINKNEFDEEDEDKKSTCNNYKNSTCCDELFDGFLKKLDENDECFGKILLENNKFCKNLNEDEDDNEDMDEKTIFFPETKYENKNNILQLEDIL